MTGSKGGMAAAWGLVLLAAAAARAEEPPADKACLVAVPVADLRAEPKRVDGAAALKTPYPQDPLQETQLIYGERVRLLASTGAWARVEAVEQPEFTHAEAWTGYPGWMLKEALVPAPADWKAEAVVQARYARVLDSPSRKAKGLSIPLGARVQVTFQKGAWARVRKPAGGEGWMHKDDLRLPAELPAGEDARRQSVLATAALFLGEPYYWGGRAGHRPDADLPSGVDCSALVHLAYRVAGVDVPRDAHEQFLRSQPLESPAGLKPGDLIFLAWTKKRDRITHVMLYAGGDEVLEAVQEQNVVRRVTVKEKLGKALKDISLPEPVGERRVYLGRLMPE